ncbi:hypothetical protein FOA52_001454 [Chlamydomonas sp. UWO 241]|nr:hypothetical protein FOA52_001454 [Chlamydomonas sp. UWO 241]
MAEPAPPQLDGLFDDEPAEAPTAVAPAEEEDLEDDMGDEERPASGSGAGPSAEDRRAALLKLAQKKRKEAGEGEPKKRKPKKGAGDKGEGEGSQKRKRGKEAARAERPRMGAAGGGDGEEPGEDAVRAPRGDDEVDSDEDVGGDVIDFIDDDGVAVGEVDDRSDGDDDVGGGPAEEALEVAAGEEGDDDMEADDGDDPFGHKKKKKKKESEGQMAMVVDDKIAKMEAAAEADMEQHEAKRAAIQKLKCFNEVEDFLNQKKYHELFISAGGLGVLKAWIEPYADGSLPNSKIRTMVLRACKLLPIDTNREDMKGQLKKSQLGNRIMFLLKCPEETQPNKQIARELVQAWSRPIFYNHNLEDEKRRVKNEVLVRARAAAVEAQRIKEADAAAAKPLKVKYGEAGYRWHASIPQASKLDYVVPPDRNERAAAAAAAASQGRVAEKDTRFAKKMRAVQRKQQGVAARAAKPSVEGRTIIVMSND